MQKIIRVLKIRKYKAGYHTVKYIVSGKEYSTLDLEITSAFTNDTLQYIGESKQAHFLYKKMGLTKLQSREPIIPPKNKQMSDLAKDLLTHNLMSDYTFSPCTQIGFNESEQKWYGWSHRAISGFGVDSSVKIGDCGYVPSNKQDAVKDAIMFWTDENHKNILCVSEENKNGLKGFLIEWTYSDDIPNVKIRNKIGGVFCEYPDKWGRGEWTAKTLEDSKQMAIDFADGVS